MSKNRARGSAAGLSPKRIPLGGTGIGKIQNAQTWWWA